MAPTFSKHRATVIGVTAVCFWAFMVSTMRLTTQYFGTLLGPCILYTIASAALWVVRRPHAIKSFPKNYLVIGAILVAFVEIATSQAVGLAANEVQTIEVGIVNYLWPTFTVLLTVISSKDQKTSWLIVPGTILATGGVICALGGDAGLSISAVAQNVSSNPLPYGLIFCAASLWACYSVFTPRIAEGHDGLAIFFTFTAVCLWVLYFANGAPLPETNPGLLGVFTAVFAAFALAAGYACWNIGIIYGNMNVMATVSYATPILSTLVSMVLLHATLSVPFWLGAVAVAAGSLISWLATSGQHLLHRKNPANDFAFRKGAQASSAENSPCKAKGN